MEDTAHLLHSDGPGNWIRDTPSLINRSQTCEEQVGLWAASVPDWLSIHSTPESSMSNEFAHFLRSRLLQWRQMLTLPLLYVVAHTSDAGPQARAKARECIDFSAQRILSNPYLGRHGGTWFVLRHTFMSAMAICAYKLSSEEDYSDDWERAIDIAIEILRAWSGQADDVNTMYEFLDMVVGRVRSRSTPSTPVVDSTGSLRT